MPDREVYGRRDLPFGTPFERLPEDLAGDPEYPDVPDEREHVSSVRQVVELLRQVNAMTDRIRAGEEIPLPERITFQRFKVQTLRRCLDDEPSEAAEEVLAAAERELQRMRLEADQAGVGHVG